jgi:hypothetical protein
MISLCTDFGRAGPYVGQLEAVLARAVPGVPVIDLSPTCQPPCAPQLAALPSVPHGSRGRRVLLERVVHEVDRSTARWTQEAAS